MFDFDQFNFCHFVIVLNFAFKLSLSAYRFLTGSTLLAENTFLWSAYINISIYLLFIYLFAYSSSIHCISKYVPEGCCSRLCDFYRSSSFHISGIYEDVKEKSELHWVINGCHLLREFRKKPILPIPFSLPIDIITIIKWLVGCKIKGMKTMRSNTILSIVTQFFL